MSETPSSFEFSTFGHDFLKVKEALPFAERARAIEGVPSAQFGKIKRITRLSIPGHTIPESVATMKHLRWLQIGSPKLKEVPAFVFDLPKLSALILSGTSIRHLKGVERSRTLRDIEIMDTPLCENDEARTALVASLPGAQDLQEIIAFTRQPGRAPKQKAELLRALAADEVDDNADLRGVDLSKQTFEDCSGRWDLRGANLAGTVWKRCDFEHANFEGANLERARFEQCSFHNVSMKGIIGTELHFDGCAFHTVDFSKATLRAAVFASVEKNPYIEFAAIKGEKMQFAAALSSAREIEVVGKKADLRGAIVLFDAGARSGKQPDAALATKKFVGAKTDALTRIGFGTMDTAVATEKKATASPKGKQGGQGAQGAQDAHSRRFELVDGSSSKFWEIALAGNSFTTRFGKIGTLGQSSTKAWDSPSKAQAEHDKLVREKVNKGYREKRK